jgi:hypothetical protein
MEVDQPDVMHEYFTDPLGEIAANQNMFDTEGLINSKPQRAKMAQRSKEKPIYGVKSNK